MKQSSQERPPDGLTVEKKSEVDEGECCANVCEETFCRDRAASAKILA